MKTLNLLLLLCLSALTSFAGIWQPITESSLKIGAEREITPDKCRYYQLNINQVRDQLSILPFASEVSIKTNNDLLIELPDPRGVLQTFKVKRNQVLPVELNQKYPMIGTFTATSVESNSVTAFIDITAFGFHAMVIQPSGSYFIDPLSRASDELYQVYDKKDFKASKQFDCLVSELSGEKSVNTLPSMAARTHGDELRNYKLALACTGEYSAYHGGTKPQVLSAIVTSVNRVSGIYQIEFAVVLSLIPNNDTLIFLSGSTDPYTNNNGSAMLGQNQSTCDSYIGSSNYDIGHVFSTGGGGIAGLRVICKQGSKARGVTGSGNPVGDPFDVDYVAHEMGHQFGGNHTFNSTVGACNGNRVSTAAYEPGSGSTIMAYAGICGSNNLQPHSDPYFHTKSFDEIVDYITIDFGSVCPVTTLNGNNLPVINPGGNYIIPYQTPFRLTGSATDADGDTLTYCWEEFDLGPAGSWSAPSGDAPIFRSFNPTTDSVRLFPKLLAILNNTNYVGEIKPSYARTLKFRLTVRDNRNGGGGVTYNDVPVLVDVINTGTAFAVTSPNTTGITWAQGTVQTITWDVGGSDLPPVSTPNVNILLSEDGGQTFPYVLATNVPNNGTSQVTLPMIITNTARVMVEGAGNIFFDINDKNFAIGTVGISEQNSPVQSIYPNPATDQTVINIRGNKVYQLLILDVTGRIVNDLMLSQGQHILNTSDWSGGVYFINCFDEGKRVGVHKLIVH